MKGYLPNEVEIIDGLVSKRWKEFKADILFSEDMITSRTLANQLTQMRRIHEETDENGERR